MNVTKEERRSESADRLSQSRAGFLRSVPLSDRAAYSPAEFAALCGRSPTWGYRQIYAGRIRPISDCGRLLIPRSEVDSFLARKVEYNPVAVGGGE
jgi:helix-turn-helix protein